MAIKQPCRCVKKIIVYYTYAFVLGLFNRRLYTNLILTEQLHGSG